MMKTNVKLEKCSSFIMDYRSLSAHKIQKYAQHKITGKPSSKRLFAIIADCLRPTTVPAQPCSQRHRIAELMHQMPHQSSRILSKCPRAHRERGIRIPDLRTGGVQTDLAHSSAPRWSSRRRPRTRMSQEPTPTAPSTQLSTIVRPLRARRWALCAGALVAFKTRQRRRLWH